MRRRGEEGGGGGVSQPKEKRESHDPHIATTRSHCPHAAYSRPPESETMWEESGYKKDFRATASLKP